jgi:hypothetical protein
MTTKFGPLTKAFCLKRPRFRLLRLCSACDETVSKEGSKKYDCPRFCACEGNSEVKAWFK